MAPPPLAITNPRTSTRISIGWGNNPTPTEDTDTLVITTRDYSLDLRIFIEGNQREGEIDWATVSYISELPGSTKENPKYRWDPIINSRPPPPTDLPDEGSFSTLPNGDVQETGIMYNPQSGLEEPYIEVWRRHPLPSASKVLVLESTTGTDKAFIGRVGERSIGLMSDEVMGFSAYRATLRVDHWEVDFQQTDRAGAVLPLLPTTGGEEEDWRDGDEVEWGGRKWTVKDHSVSA